MKYLLLILFMSSNAFASDCNESSKVVTTAVTYEVNTNLPKHLKGASITVTLADGKTSTVPAEKFMVVPRKQKTLLGQNKVVTNKITCDKSNKNIVTLEAREDIKDVESSSVTTTNGVKVKAEANKAIIPALNYYRRSIIKNLGAGVGIDSNGTPKVMIGVDF